MSFTSAPWRCPYAADDRKTGLRLAFGAAILTFETQTYFTPGFYHLFAAYGGVSLALSPNNIAVSKGPAEFRSQRAVEVQSVSSGQSRLPVGGGCSAGAWVGLGQSQRELGSWPRTFAAPFSMPRPLLGKHGSIRLEVKNDVSGPAKLWHQNAGIHPELQADRLRVLLRP